MTTTSPRWEPLKLSVNTTLENTDPLSMNNARGLQLANTTSTAMALTFYESDTRNGTYIQCVNDSGVDLTRTIPANRSIRMPLELFACGYIKIVSDNAGIIRVGSKG